MVWQVSLERVREINMDCKEVNKMIPAFLNKELTGRELSAFMEHIEKCPECKEEFSIQFLVFEGMVSLEDGNTFDLQKEMDKLMEDAKRKLRIRRGFHFLIYGVEILAIILIIAIIILIMII